MMYFQYHPSQIGCHRANFGTPTWTYLPDKCYKVGTKVSIRVWVKVIVRLRGILYFLPGRMLLALAVRVLFKTPAAEARCVVSHEFRIWGVRHSSYVLRLQPPFYSPLHYITSIDDEPKYITTFESDIPPPPLIGVLLFQSPSLLHNFQLSSSSFFPLNYVV